MGSQHKASYEVLRKRELNPSAGLLGDKVALTKVIRFATIYGWQRAMVKVAARTRITFFKYFFKAAYTKHKQDTSLIGCGQFAFSTISYFIQKKRGNVFLDCYDINEKAAKTCAAVWGYHLSESAEQVYNNPSCEYVFIASDHFSHTEYAIKCLQAGKTIHLEKPVSVTREQFAQLLQAKRIYSGRVFAGYNRPYSRAIQTLDNRISDSKGPITLGCYVIGHKIESDHWYRIPKEGTRVCGNIGHWFDLSMHLFNIRCELPAFLDIQIMQSDSKEIDDNLTVSYRTNIGDLVTITLTSRNEPFEGINETIVFQCGEVNAIIEDFRVMTLLEREKKNVYKYRPKDVGHARSIMQVYSEKNRDWKEVVYSTLLMLKVKEMVLNGESTCRYNIERDYNEMIQV